jgi:Protein of unknown function (DUF3631)
MSLTRKKPTNQRGVNPLDQVLGVIARHLDTKPHYLVGAALWVFHTHIYMRYHKSPRLAILSPVQDCGKSTVLDILGAMVWNPKRVSDPSASSLRDLAKDHTMLIDEVDNMPIIRNMKSVLNEGHSYGGSVTRTGKDGEVISYPVYGPVALAGIGKLPAPLMSRSLVIHMYRGRKTLERFNPRDHYYASQFYNWADQVNLNPDPIMPAQIIGRSADKWRPLIAIADSFDRSELARDVALEFLKESVTLDIKEQVLRDTQKVFENEKTDILTVDTLFQKLREDGEGEYEVDYIDLKVTKRKIGDLLANFQIRSRLDRLKGGKPTRYWSREDFEEMWERFTPKS